MNSSVKTRAIGGETRRSRAKRQGRNAIRACCSNPKWWQHHGKADAGDEVDERESGETPDESQERRSENNPTGADGTRTTAMSPRSREERSPRGPGFCKRPQGSEQKTVIQRETSKVQPGDRQERTRRGEGKRPATNEHLVNNVISKEWRCTTDPEEPAKRSRIPTYAR
jgi:hypothetical protein